MKGRWLSSSNVVHVDAKCGGISPAANVSIPAHADAEPIGFAPIYIEVLPSCLKLMVPR